MENLHFNFGVPLISKDLRGRKLIELKTYLMKENYVLVVMEYTIQMRFCTNYLHFLLYV